MAQPQDSQSASSEYVGSLPTETPAPEVPSEAIDTPATETPPKVTKEEKPRVPLRDRIAQHVEQVQKTKGKSDEPVSKPTLGTGVRGPDGKFQKPADPATPPVDPAAAVTEPVTPPTYAPNFKYKHALAKGDPKQAEGEFHEVFKDWIKTPEQEEIVRSLYAKAGGLDFIKPQFLELRTKHQELSGAHEQVLGGIQDLRSDYQRGDFDSFFNKLKIPQEKVLQWVMEKVNYSELPPEQRAVIDARRQAENRALEAERRAQEAETSHFEQSRTNKAYALDISLTRPDVSAVAQSFDTRVGKPGAFRELVAQHGESVWYRSNGEVNLTPDQAIEQVMNQFGIQASAPAPTATLPVTPTPVAAPVAPPAPAPVAARPAPTVIPNVQSRAGSPAAGKTPPKNLKELRRMAAEAQ